MKPPFDPTYGPLVIEATGCSREETYDVLQVMRETHSTLDHLKRNAFIRLARSSYALVRDRARSR